MDRDLARPSLANFGAGELSIRRDHSGLGARWRWCLARHRQSGRSYTAEVLQTPRTSAHGHCPTLGVRWRRSGQIPRPLAASIAASHPCAKLRGQNLRGSCGQMLSVTKHHAPRPCEGLSATGRTRHLKQQPSLERLAKSMRLAGATYGAQPCAQLRGSLPGLRSSRLSPATVCARLYNAPESARARHPPRRLHGD